MNPRMPWYFWVILSGILLGLSALIGGCTEGRTVPLAYANVGGTATFTTMAGPGTPATPSLNHLRAGDSIEIRGFANATLNGTFTVAGPASGAGVTTANVGQFTVALASPPPTTAALGTVVAPVSTGLRICEAMILGLFGAWISAGFVWLLLHWGSYRPWTGAVIGFAFFLSPLWIVLELIWWIAGRFAGRDWRFHASPLALVLLALTVGWYAGTQDGTWQIRTWNVLWQMPLDHTWGLSGTTNAALVKLINGPGEHVKPEYAAPMSVAGRTDYHQYVNGFAIAPTAVFTQGMTMSNQAGIGLGGTITGNGDPNPLSTHEEQHIIQNRIFGPLFTSTYLGWMGVTFMPSVLAGGGAGNLGGGIMAWTYANNPFEVWGYTTGGSPVGMVGTTGTTALLWASPLTGLATWTAGPVVFFTFLLLFGVLLLGVAILSAWWPGRARWWAVFGEGGGCALLRYLLLGGNLAVNVGLTIALWIASPVMGVLGLVGTTLTILAWFPVIAGNRIGHNVIGCANLLAPTAQLATVLGIVAFLLGLLGVPISWLCRLRSDPADPNCREPSRTPNWDGSSGPSLPTCVGGVALSPPTSTSAIFAFDRLCGRAGPVRLVVVGTWLSRLHPVGVSFGLLTFLNPARLHPDDSMPEADDRFLAGLSLNNAAFGFWQYARFFDMGQPGFPDPRRVADQTPVLTRSYWDLLAESAVPVGARSTTAFTQEPERPRLPQWGVAPGADRFVHTPLVAGVLFSVLWLIIIVAFATWGWPGAPDSCVATNTCYSEKHPLPPGTVVPAPWTSTGWAADGIKQPSNTWSDLAYVIFGLIILWQVGRDRRRIDSGGDSPANPMLAPSFFAISYGLITIFLGFGSMLFHASLTEWGGFCDNLSMYLWTSWLIAYDITRLNRAERRGWSLGLFALIFTPLILITCLIRLAYPPSSLIIFTVLVLATIATGVWMINLRQAGGVVREPHATAWKASFLSWIWAGLGVFVGAFATWNLSSDGRPLSDPLSYFQGHAFWHIGGAFTAFAVWFNLRSETTAENPPPIGVGGVFRDLLMGFLGTLARLPQLILWGLIPLTLFLIFRLF